MSSFTTLTVAVTLLTLSFPLGSNADPWPKRGLAFNNPSQWIQNWQGGQVNWAYNWDSYMDDTFPEYLEFIPMLWGTGDDHVSNVRFLPFHTKTKTNNPQSGKITRRPLSLVAPGTS